ncbi:hypothetical protein EB796_000097 [Bugula neritina]|uniref:Uncharacterized protein n=1 Tax=Bugula neritina TaxID=10212 RepID=A0A7J7KTT2_BUGNE|nr:hypothetical protein EB796_000097 [Bugula neritina]
MLVHTVRSKLDYLCTDTVSMMSISDYPGVLVIDNGSRTTQAGLAGDDAPSILFSTVVGKQENEVIKMLNFVNE